MTLPNLVAVEKDYIIMGSLLLRQVIKNLLCALLVFLGCSPPLHCDIAKCGFPLQKFFLDDLTNFVLANSILQLPDKLPSFPFITSQLLLQPFPGSRAILIGNSHYSMKCLINLFSVARSDLNAGLSQDVLHMTKIARHDTSPPCGFSPR